MSSEEQFWQEFASLLIQLTCLIEREKLKKEVTTADLRREGKKAICNLTNEES